jgi:hypothetical protein
VRVFVAGVILAVGLFGLRAGAQEDLGTEKSGASKSEPKYSDTFAGPIVELFFQGTSTKRSRPDDAITRIAVSRSILGKPAEKRTFWIKPDTRIEGNLRMKAKVTVGFVTTDDGDVARLIVVRTTQRPQPEKK